MEQGYDGEVVIKARIDESGINKGTEKIGDAIADEFGAMGQTAEAGTAAVGKSLVSLLPAAKGVFGKITAAVGAINPALLAVGAGMLVLGSVTVNAFKGVMGVIQTVKDKLLQLAKTIITSVRSTIERFVSTVKNVVTSIARYLFTQLVSAITKFTKNVIASAAEVDQLKGSFTELNATVRTLGTDLVSLFIPQIQTTINWLVNLLNIIRQVIAALKGQTSYTKVVADELGKAGGAAEKAAGALAAFDEINVLQQPGGAGGGGGGGLGEEEVPIDQEWIDLAGRIAAAWDVVKQKFLELWAVIEPFRNFINQTADDFKTNFLTPVSEWVLGPGWDEFIRITDELMQNSDWDGLADSLNRFYAAVAKLTIGVFQGLLTFYDRFLRPITEWTVNEGLPRFLDSLSDAVEDIDWEYLNEQWGLFLDALTEFTLLNLDNLLWFVTEILIPIGKWTIDEVVPRFFHTLASVLRILTAVLEALKPLWLWFFDEVLAPMTGWEADTFLDFWDLLNEKLDTLATWLEDNPDKIREFFIIVLGLGVTAFMLLAIALAPVVLLFGLLALAIATALLPLAAIIVYITLVIAAIWLLGYEIGKLAHMVYNKIQEMKENWEGFKEGVKTAIRVAVDYVKNKWDELKTAFKAEGIKGALNVVIGWIENFVNIAINGINALIDLLNNFSIDIPAIEIAGHVIYGGGSISPFNFTHKAGISIPRLAQGAVIPPNSQFLAVLGDQRSGRNIEAPEDLLREIIREELDGMGGQDVTIKFAGSLSPLIRELKPYIDKEDKRVGVSMVRGIS